MSIRQISLNQFSGFNQSELSFSPGINVLIGVNGSSKSHLMKLIYSVWKTAESHGKTQQRDFETHLKTKLAGVFKPENDELRRLVRRAPGQRKASVALCGDNHNISFNISTQSSLTLTQYQVGGDSSTIFIPSREALAMYEGFVQAYQNRELSFDETYFDLCMALSGSALKGPRGKDAAALAGPLEEILGGKVRLEGNRFKVKLKSGDMEAHLLSEGLRKIASLVHLISNGSLREQSVLFWDEPEANLNPRLVIQLVKTLVKLAERGVQIILASHDYLLTHELSLLCEYEKSAVGMNFISLTPGEDGLTCSSGATLAELDNNPILDEFAAHYDREQLLFTE